MKKLNAIFTLAVCLSAFALTSCDKDKTASPLTIDLTKKAVIKGYVYADLDLTTPGLEKAPAGTQIIITVSNDDLDGTTTDMFWKKVRANETPGVYSATFTVDSDGKINAEIPVGNSETQVYILPVTFEAQQKQSDTESVLKYFTPEDDYSYEYLIPNQSKVVLITYEANSFTDEVIEVK